MPLRSMTAWHLSKGLAIAAMLGTFSACDSAVDPSEPNADFETESLGAPQLADPHPCAGHPGFTCATLTVPLDYGGGVRGTRKLQVGTADNVDAPKGVLLILTGGPGQPGVPFLTRLAARMPDLAKAYRIVMFDQRGTGEFGAIDCPALQAQVGSSDIATPSEEAVTSCAVSLGHAAPFFSSDQTVADIDRLRRALGVDTMAVDGVSYGTITAARYAIAHPRNVGKVVLDSVAPYHWTAADTLFLHPLRAAARILREACTVAPACEFDPAEDLAAVVRSRDTAAGVAIFDTVVTYEYVDVTFRNPNPPNFPAGRGDLIGALHAARNGDSAKLDALVAILKSGGGPIAQFSSGLHAATICADLRFPWGDAATPLPVRGPLLELTEKRLDDRDTWPYTPAVAVSHGWVKTCQWWPVERPASNPRGPLPRVPVLLINGERDLATPLEGAQEVAATAPMGELVVVKGESHGIQSRERGHAGRDAVTEFLLRP